MPKGSQTPLDITSKQPINLAIGTSAAGANTFISSLATSSLKGFYDDVVYWEIAKNTNKFFVTFERGQYAVQNGKQESIGTMELHYPRVDNNSGSGFLNSASLGGSRENAPYNSFFQEEEETSVSNQQHHGYNGFIPLTEIRGTRYWQTTLTSSISKPYTLNYEVSTSAAITTTRNITASYFYPFSNYQLSVLRNSPTIIIDLDKASELPSYAAEKGFAAIPFQTHQKVKDNFEYYLEKAGLLNKTTKTKMPKKGI